jgi:hypothetical protein
LQKTAASSEVPGLQRGSDGKYTGAIWANRDDVVFDYDPKGEFRVFSQIPGKQVSAITQNAPPANHLLRFKVHHLRM